MPWRVLAAEECGPETTRLKGNVYLAPEGCLDFLLEELGEAVVERWDRLVLAREVEKPPLWVQNSWDEPVIVHVTSIASAARHLRSLHRNWIHYPLGHHRRAALIQQQLPYVSGKPLPFPSPLPTGKLGSWTLLSPDLLLASPRCSSPFPNGEARFIECRQGPPSRAYLKLWETFTRIGRMPQQGQRCLEIGASPGGWTWVLVQLGASVTCVDRSPLAPEIGQSPLVHFLKKDAFQVLPDSVERLDWIFSDVACYPEKLLEWLKLWLQSGKCSKFVCTLKIQGSPVKKTLEDFAAIPGGRLVHLFHNKHEITWIYLS